MKTLLSVDVEIWLDAWDLGQESFRDGYRRFILGDTGRDAKGLPYQLECLRAHGLKCVFFVEPLFACHFGIAPLRDIVAMIQEGGQEVQLHPHTEWNGFMRDPIVPGRHGVNLRDFTAPEQLQLVSRGREYLFLAGAKLPIACRAGNFGAGEETLGVLRQLGIEYDSSYDLAATTGPFLKQRLLCPVLVGGIKELPIGVFETYRGGFRHAQVGAASYEEIEASLAQAHADAWPVFVIYWHSAELLNRTRRTASAIAERRFLRLLKYLADHRDRFETIHFSDLAGDDDLYGKFADKPFRVSAYPTLRRHLEQVGQRLGF
jgi:hypothetical protein